MINHIIHPFTEDKERLHQLFEKLSTGNTILFLGAGASVSEEKRYLSSDIIEYYEDKTGKSFGITNITEFLDVLAETEWFDRREFDQYVYELLSRLKVSDVHRTIVSMQWRQIITTNFDLLLEKAENELRENSKLERELLPVRDVKEYNHFYDNTQTQYIKLNGCMNDRSRYPFLFSTKDFNSAKQFYKKVLTSLKSLSDRITFLSAGYSYSDDFAKKLLDSFDVYNYRDKRVMYNIDPYINDHKLDFLRKQNVCIIKSTVLDFFKEFKAWEENNYARKLASSKRPTFTNSSNSVVNLSSKLSYNLKGSIEQLNSYYKGYASEEKYYKGDEPNYSVIENNYDVVRTGKLREVKKNIGDIFSSKHILIPIIFLKGNFGTGKTTFNYRLIHDLIKTSAETIAFEILDIDNIRREYFKDLIEHIKSKTVIIFCNKVEIDSVYKSILDLRSYLSALQLSEINIFFILSIRENMLEIHKNLRQSKSIFEFNIDSKLTRSEIEDLLDRLNRYNIVHFRDSLEKAQLINKIETKYDGDSFIALLNLVTEGRHINNLREAYFQLSEKCQKAFIYTALVHRYNLSIPSSVLKNLVATDWEEFTQKVINVEGKGILIQELKSVNKGSDPDLYFRTKHPLIADKLIIELHPRPEKRFSLYRELVRNTTPGTSTSRFITNLLKALRQSKEFGDSRVDNLFDEASKIFQDEAHFLLQYSINLQHRGAKTDLQEAISRLQYAETLLESRNDRFVHRKGVLFFKLAQLFYKEEKSELNFTLKYLDEAREWLLLKQQLDPCSSFSYYDLLSLLIWEIEFINFSDQDLLRKRIKIEDYFDLAIHAVAENLNLILELKDTYEVKFHSSNNSTEYLRNLLDMYDDLDLRPFACVLMLNYYLKNDIRDKAAELLDEIEQYKDEEEVSKFLFKYYGRNLNDINIRLKFFRLSKPMEWYEEENPLRYNYNHYVAEAYGMQLTAAYSYLNRINERYKYVNPEYQRVWLDPSSSAHRVFLGAVKLNKRGFKVFYSAELHKEFKFSMTNLDEISIGQHCSVNLCFFLDGIRAINLVSEG